MDNVITPIIQTDSVFLSLSILLLPFISFLVNSLWIGRKSAKAAGIISTGLLGLTCLFATILVWQFYYAVLLHPEIFPSRSTIAWEFNWMSFDFGNGVLPAVKFGFLMDPISMMMVWVISFISFLVHGYSIGYMKDDKSAGRFFPLLSFFTFTMLGLIVATNLVQTFFFWELVGTASYLLIGFWYQKPGAVAASKKAFILTRFTDAFFLIGLLVIGVLVGSFDYSILSTQSSIQLLNHPISLGNLYVTTITFLTLGTLLIYMGAWGKSAMFPFHVWLPDAMEGPTPVSSLIHSATMVVAGIYLVARLFPLFSAAEYTLQVVQYTGAFTALFAASIACTQTDIKRILAFSTLSQLGLMMYSLGVSNSSNSNGFSASLFHVFTHAFFKCLLFLSAGIVIHSIHSNDIRDAGMLRKILPRTYWTTLIACLAIVGVFPLAGFFSKEEILHAAWRNGQFGDRFHLGFFAVLVTGGLTAFYMSRYFFLIFHRNNSLSNSADLASSASNSKDPNPNRPFREGFAMTLPILVLAVPSLFAGWLCQDFFTYWIFPSSTLSSMERTIHEPTIFWLPLVASLMAVLGISVSGYLYAVKKSGAGYADANQPLWFQFLYKKFYMDEVYLFLIKQVAARLVSSPISWLEKIIVNGSFDWVSAQFRRASGLVGLIQSGQVQFYIVVSLIGLLTIVWFSGIHF